MKKRLLIMALICTLILSQVSLNVSASESENLDYAQKLKKIGVFIGSDQGFELERPATRLEGIILLIRLLGEEDEALDTHYDIPFTDVPDWAFSYVSYAYNYGLSNGVSDTSFGSQDELTAIQYFTFMARALGYDDEYGDFVWDQSLIFLNEIGFISLEEKASYENKTLLRSDIAKLSYDLLGHPIKNSSLLLVDTLLQSNDLDAEIAEEIGLYTPIQTKRSGQAIVKENTLVSKYNNVNIERSVDQGYPSPYSVPDSINASSLSTNRITFTDGLQGQALFDSLTHQGFDGVKADYDVSNISMNDFFDSLSINDEPYSLSVQLKNNNLYEHKIYDEYSQSYAYYEETSNIYYEASELYLGNYSDPIEELTKETFGTQVYMQAFKANDYPTYNPLILDSEESLQYITFTSIDDETLLYIELQRLDDFVQQWISLKEGLVVKEYIFDNDGTIKSIKNNTSIINQVIPDSTFEKQDIDYRDLTLLIYSLSYDNLDSLLNGLTTTFSPEPFSFDLVAEGETKYTLHVSGYDGGEAFDDFGYISHQENSLGQLIEIRQVYDDGLFYTIVPSMSTVETYADSIQRLVMFNFDELSFRNIVSKDNYDIYTFENTSYKGLNDLPQFYDYKINTSTNKIESITKYFKESHASKIFLHQTIYTLENFGTFDESLFDIPDHYKVIEHNPLEYYDGEHPLQWYYYTN